MRFCVRKDDGNTVINKGILRSGRWRRDKDEFSVAYTKFLVGQPDFFLVKNIASGS